MTQLKKAQTHKNTQKGNEIQGFNVRSTARATGIRPELLRAWENRYGIIAPKRTETGHRRYTPQQVEHLKLLKQLTFIGHSIQTLSKLTETQLGQLLAQKKIAPDNDSQKEDPAVSLIEAFDFLALEKYLHRKLLQNAPRDFFLKILVPLLQELGFKSARQEISIAQEHIVSAVIRKLLVNFYSNVAIYESNSKKILITTQENDFHELGALIGACLAALEDRAVFYLGPSLPPKEIYSVAKQMKAQELLVASIFPMDSYAAYFAQQKPEFKIWLAGPNPLQQPSPNKKIRAVLSFESFAKELHE